MSTVRLYNADCLDILPTLEPGGVVLVFDPPYGIGYASRMTGYHGGVALPGIVGDEDTSLRDAVLAMFPNTSALVFGTWKRSKPVGCHTVLTWEKGDHVGMGNLSVPWKPNTEEIYVIGSGFTGHRGSSVLKHNAPVSWNSTTFGRDHAHEKPVSLMLDLLKKCPPDCVVVDPFMGSGSTAIAAMRLDRDFIGIEQDPGHYATVERRVDRERNRHPLFAGMAE